MCVVYQLTEEANLAVHNNSHHALVLLVGWLVGGPGEDRLRRSSSSSFFRGKQIVNQTEINQT